MISKLSSHTFINNLFIYYLFNHVDSQLCSWKIGWWNIKTGYLKYHKVAWEVSEEFPPTPSDSVIHALFIQEQPDHLLDWKIHTERKTQGWHTHSLSLFFFYRFLKQRGVNDWPNQICTMPISWIPRMPMPGLGMMHYMNGTWGCNTDLEQLLNRGSSDMDSTGLETSGLLHHQATEGFWMSYREDMWVMSEYCFQMIK